MRWIGRLGIAVFPRWTRLSVGVHKWNAVTYLYVPPIIIAWPSFRGSL